MPFAIGSPAPAPTPDPWLGYSATNRRFTRIPEVSIYTIQHGKIAHVWGLEDTYHRLKQLGLNQPS